MTTYTDGALSQIEAEYSRIAARYRSLIEKLVVFRLTNAEAQLFMHHGVARRLSTMNEAIKITFSAIPPNQDRAPTDENRSLATVGLHSHIINCYGVLDNLAHVWVNETGVTGKDGTSLMPIQVGFRKKHAIVIASLQKPLKGVLDEMHEWIEYLVSFRDSLSHRIPLYIPPYMIDPSRQEDYISAEKRKRAATSYAEYEQLNKEIAEMHHFKAFMIHHLATSDPIAFHAQMIADFKTVNKLCIAVMDTLEIGRI